MLRRRAYAKINIGLHILGKRDDGYHAVATVLAPIELHDELTFKKSDEVSVQMRPSLGIEERENLAYRAATLLRRALAITAGAKITITKHIPHGSGLGGGSSDAAAVLCGLLELWNVTLDPEHLATLALELGSDVPFFLAPRLSYAEGRGEQLSPLPPMEPRVTLIVAPPLHISTAWAYAQLQLHPEHVRPRPLRDAVMVSALSDELLRSVCTNDFEPIVFRTYPELASIKSALYAAGARYASLTGTGSALFGFFDSEDAALRAAAQFPASYRTFVTRTLATAE